MSDEDCIGQLSIAALVNTTLNVHKGSHRSKQPSLVKTALVKTTLSGQNRPQWSKPLSTVKTILVIKTALATDPSSTVDQFDHTGRMRTKRGGFDLPQQKQQQARR